MVTVRIRSLVWFAAGIAVALIATAVFVGIRATAAISAAESTFVPRTPCRVFDTRPGSFNVGPRNTPIGNNTSHTFQIAGNQGECTGIPTSATAISLNLVAVQPTAASFIAAYPGGTPNPGTAVLNFTAGQPPTPNKIDVKLSPDGKLTLFNRNGTVHVVGDVLGYYTNGGLQSLDRQSQQNHTFVARVSANGSKRGTGPYTSSRSGTGRYSVEFDLTRHPIHASPNAATVYEPVGVVNARCGGAVANATFGSFSIDATGYYVNFAAAVDIDSTAGIPTDCVFDLVVTVEDPNSLVIVPA